MSNADLIPLAPVAVVLLGFIGWCQWDIWRGRPPAHLPRWAWSLIALVSVPIGAVVYLIVGRARPETVDDVPMAPTALQGWDPRAVPAAPATAPGLSAPSVTASRAPSVTASPAPSVTASPAASGAGISVGTDGLTRDFGGGAGVFDVRLKVPATGVFAVIGPNGAGKTTLFTLLTGLDRPDRGTVALGARIASCPDTPEFEPWLTAAEVLRQSQTLSGGAGSPARALDLVGLAAVADRRVGAFSRGMTQRLGIAATLVTGAGILVFDEPTSALDPFGRHEVLSLLRSLARDRAVLVSSHSLAEVEKIADRVAVLDRGRVVACGTLDELIRTQLRPTWTIRVSGSAAAAAEGLAGRPGVRECRATGPGLLSMTFADVDEGARRLPGLLAEAGVGLLSAEPEAGDLDGAFAALIQRAREESQHEH